MALKTVKDEGALKGLGPSATAGGPAAPKGKPPGADPGGFKVEKPSCDQRSLT
jgi:hypothetical protein